MNFFEQKQSPSFKEIKTFKQSNLITESVYNASLLENKLLSYALAKAEFQDGRMIAYISMGEIRTVFNEPFNKRIYERLHSAANRMTNFKIYTEDALKKSFSIANLIGVADYEGGMFIVKFEPDLTEYIRNIQTNYTLFNLSTLMSIDNVYAYRLYEILKSRAYNHIIENHNDSYELTFSLSELKLLLGIIDISSEKVARELKKPSPNYDYIVNNLSKNHHHNRWDAFVSRALNPAVKTINEKTDIDVSYQTVRVGRGGKVYAITFNFNKKPEKLKLQKINITEKELEEMVDELITYFDVSLKISDAKALLAAADYNIEIIKKAYDLSLEQKRIDNLIAWLLTAIKNNFIDSDT